MPRKPAQPAQQGKQGKRTLFVTVGSTLFPLLTNAILSPSTLALLPTLGVGRLVVQYGRAAVPSYLDIEVDTQGAGKGVIGELEVELLRYTDDFEGLVKDSDAVISHAGSGSILSVLRRQPAPPLLIVPNETLMDNHQAELADELGKQGYLMDLMFPSSALMMLTRRSRRQLEESLPLYLGGQWAGSVKPFPAVDGERFRSVLDETMGFV